MKNHKVRNSFLCIVFTFIAVNVSAAQSDRVQVASKYHQLKKKTSSGETLRVIVKVKGTDKQQTRKKKAAERTVMLRKNKQKHSSLKSHLSRKKIKLNREFERLGYMTMEVNSVQLDELIDSGLVDSVIEEPVFYPTLSDSVSVIGADFTHLSGYTGAGQAVVIIDTGVESSHEDFGGRVVEEACFSTTTDTYSSLCPTGEDEEIGIDAAVPCDTYCSHGTHVASIAAGANGVAPEANIVAVQAFSWKEIDNKISGQWGDLLAALEWVLESSTTENIAAINMSLGDKTLYTSACDTNLLADTISDLREAGITTVIASGNDSFTTGVASPACISDAITVGNTTKLDALNSSSNSSVLVDVLAPGTSIYAAVPGSSYGTKSGTSMAAPHVAGAIAVLRSVKSDAEVDTLELTLESTGTDVTDENNDVTKPRIEVNAAALSLATVSIEPEVELVWPNGIDAVASSEQAINPAINIGDTDLSTRWSSQYAGETITLNLGSVHDLSAINIAFLKGDQRNTYFDLAISSDGNTFTTVSSGLESSGSSAALENFALSGLAQYVRIIGQGNSSNNWNSLTEVEVWGTSAEGDLLSANTLSSFEPASSTQTINVSSNVSWVLSSNDSWITVANNSGTNNGSAEVIVAENTSEDIRQGSITLSGGSITQTIQVNQKADVDSALRLIPPTNVVAENTAEGEVTITWTDMTTGEEGYKVYITSTTNDYYGINTIAANSESLVKNGIFGLDPDTYLIRVTPFSEGDFSVYTEITHVVPEVVNTPYLSASDISLFSAEQGSQTLNITANVGWTLSSHDSWITLSTTYGSGNGSSVVSVAENTSRYLRQGSITLTDGTITHDFNINQQGAVFVEAPTDLAVLVTGAGEITVSWYDESEEETGYVLEYARYYDGDSSTYPFEAISLSANTSSHVVTGLLDDWYYVRVSAVEGTASSEYAIVEWTYVEYADAVAKPESLIITDSSASSDDGNAVSNTLDNNLDTRWSANGDGEFATYDLGEVKSLSSVQIAFFKGDARNTYFSIAVSNNGTDFTTLLANQSGSGATKSLEEFFISTEARYVRIIGHGNSSNSWNSLTEVEIWGTAL